MSSPARAATVLGTSLLAQFLSGGIALGAAGEVFAWLALRMRISEARRIEVLVHTRLPGS